MFFNISKSFSPSRIRQLGRALVSQQKEVLHSDESCCRKIIPGRATNLLSRQRCYSTATKEDPSPENILPPLTDDVIRIVPGIFKSFSSLFHLQGHLRRFEPGFNMPEFVSASKQVGRSLYLVFN